MQSDAAVITVRLRVSWRTGTCSIAIDTALISAHLRPDVTEIPLTALARGGRCAVSPV